MKRNSFFFAFIAAACMLAGSASAQTGAISIDNTTNEFGLQDTLFAGQPHVVTLRLNNNTGSKRAPSSAFRIFSPDGANYGPVSGDTLPTLTKAANFDLGYFIRYASADGLNSDTVSFAGAYIGGAGIPAGFNNNAWTLNFSSQIADAGKHICVDSGFAFPGSFWTWAGTGVPAVAPTWSGQQCWLIYEVPDLPPTVTNCPVNITGSHCNTLTFDFNGTDNEGSPFTFEIVSGPGAINATTGMWSWNTATLGDVGASITLVVAARDGLTGSLGASCSVNVVVTNIGPSITDGCGTNTTISTGDTKTVDLDATDDCDPLTWSVTPTNGATGAVSVDAAGTVTYTAAVTDVGSRTFSVCVTDGLDTACCTITFNVLSGAPYKVCIEGKDIADGIYQGEFVDLDISLQSIDINAGLGGFDLLIAYDNSALSFQQALPGAIYSQCGWEFFDYRFGANGNCSGGCPSGLVRVVGLAETNNGPSNHPTCVTPKYVGALPTTLASLRFLVSSDRALECQFVPVRFFWVDCGDNTLSNATGTDLYISSKVFEYGSDDPLVTGSTLPSYLGAPNSCLTSTLKDTVVRNVDFCNGGVRIACADSIDARGDINLNGTSNEIADAVMFTNYFITGLGAFGSHVQGSIAASDVNADGNALTVADLVYLIGVIVGDRAPFPKVSNEVAYYGFENGTISVNTEIGGAFVVVKGNVTPTLAEGVNAELAYGFDGENTRILVYPGYLDFQFAGVSGNIVNVGSTEIVSVELSTVAGSPIVTNELPSTFALEQNYPNPFNPKTLIRFALPTAGEYTLTFYNVTGQVVNEVAGSASAGTVTYEWDAAGLASGVYLYKLEVKGQFTEVKKAVFLK